MGNALRIRLPFLSKLSPQHIVLLGDSSHEHHRNAQRPARAHPGEELARQPIPANALAEPAAGPKKCEEDAGVDCQRANVARMPHDGVRPRGDERLALLDRELPGEVLAQGAVAGEADEATEMHQRAPREPYWCGVDVFGP